MYLNGYSVRVIGGNEKQDGYVEMKHGQTYEIVLRNNKDTRCDAEVIIDGKEIGVFRIEPRCSFNLERPANETKKFTFYETNSEEANEAGVSKINNDNLGLIEVTFKPEKPKPKPKPLKPCQPWWDRWPWIESEPWRPRWKTTTYYYNSNSINSNFDNTENYQSDTLRSRELGPKECDHGTTLDDGVDCLRSYSADSTKGNVGTSANLSLNDSIKTNERKSGMTGLSESSKQRFYHVSELDYDEGSFITISLRLISTGNDVYEMKPITRGNPVPPPVD
jgi:hypothetical protein